jgi:hypothetical protein
MVTYGEFLEQAAKAHDELLEFAHMIQTEKLPLKAAHSFTEEDIEPIQKALEVLKKILKV